MKGFAVKVTPKELVCSIAPKSGLQNIAGAKINSVIILKKLIRIINISKQDNSTIVNRL